MSHPDEGLPDDLLENHPLRHTQEFQSDIRAREASRARRPEEAGAVGAVGGVGGALAGAGVGTMVGGPILAIVGAIAGAVGGWWAGQAASDASATFTLDDEHRYRRMHDASPNRPGDRSYDDVRAYYHLGHIARQHPDYRERAFEDIEADLQKGWTDDLRSRYGEWSSVRAYAREAYAQANQGGGA